MIEEPTMGWKETMRLVLVISWLPLTVSGATADRQAAEGPSRDSSCLVHSDDIQVASFRNLMQHSCPHDDGCVALALGEPPALRDPSPFVVQRVKERCHQAQPVSKCSGANDPLALIRAIRCEGPKKATVAVGLPLHFTTLYLRRIWWRGWKVTGMSIVD
jgi:hypothetical protein